MGTVFTNPPKETLITSADTTTITDVMSGASDETIIDVAEININNKGAEANTVILRKYEADGSTLLAELETFTIQPGKSWFNDMVIKLRGVDQILRVVTSSTSALDVSVNPTLKVVT